MSLRKICIFAVCGVLALSLFGCASNNAEDTTAAEKQQEVKADEQGDESGANASSGQSSEAASDTEQTEKVEKPIVIEDLNEFIYGKNDNTAKAVKEYEGKIVEVTGTVRRIESDACFINQSSNPTLNTIGVYLPIDDLAELESDEDEITVRGVMEIEGSGGFTFIHNAEIVQKN